MNVRSFVIEAVRLALAYNRTRNGHMHKVFVMATCPKWTAGGLL